MRKLLILALTLVLVISAPVPALARSSSRSSFRSSSRSTTRSTTPSRPSTPSRTTPRAWSNSTRYGLGGGTMVGLGALHSRTTPPKPHTYQGKNYTSVDAIYTNHWGTWVYYYAMVGATRKCYDQNHKATTCDRDKKAYSKDW